MPINSTILVIICWNFTVFWYRSASPQVKRNLISSIANLVYELPHELRNNVRLRILAAFSTRGGGGGGLGAHTRKKKRLRIPGNWEILEKSLEET